MSITDNQQYFSNTQFIKSVFALTQLPKVNSLTKELAIVGHSNCGKSSIINALTNKKKLAIISKTPGRTQAINYFQIQGNKYLVDLPGYGYAKVSSATKLAWGKLIQGYLINRTSLIGMLLIMDLRHPFKDFDLKMLEFCSKYNLSTHIVLNKADQVSQQQRQKIFHSLKAPLENFPLVSMQICSATKLIGIIELQNKIMAWLN